MRRFARSVRLAWSGILYALRTERHMRIHIGMAAAALLLAALLGLGASEWAILILLCALVLSLETVNTAIEKAVDLSSPEVHPLAKAAKDVAAGAVLIAAIAAVVIGCLLFGPPLLRLFS